MRAGRVEEADALARLIGKEMKKQCISNLSSINYKTDVAQVWRVVRELTGKPQSSAAVPGITADILNRHYAAISTDSDNHNPAQYPSPQSSRESWSEWLLRITFTHPSWLHQPLLPSQISSHFDQLVQLRLALLLF
jgi:hypothetical protein